MITQILCFVKDPGQKFTNHKAHNTGFVNLCTFRNPPITTLNIPKIELFIDTLWGILHLELSYSGGIHKLIKYYYLQVLTVLDTIS